MFSVAPCQTTSTGWHRRSGRAKEVGVEDASCARELVEVEGREKLSIPDDVDGRDGTGGGG